MEWRNEVNGDQDGRVDRRETDNEAQASRGFRQPLLSRPRFGTASEENLTEDVRSTRPMPPPRIVRWASEAERHKNTSPNQPY